ncbi:MAG: hypothetical protein M9902_08720 [Thermomonas sp.]|nr:hypothetical protein [Thermomonas sp.]MCO5055661.1 hypothetical protein [Thermomonas sp.]
MPKKRCFFMKSQTSGDRSARTWVMSQSSIIRHRVSTGPSRKACSSADSCGLGWPSSLRQSGLPENRSPSKPTEPVSSAIRSVCDSGGSALRRNFSAGAVSSGLRMVGISSGMASNATSAAITITATWLAPSSQQPTSRVALSAAQTANRRRW